MRTPAIIFCPHCQELNDVDETRFIRHGVRIDMLCKCGQLVRICEAVEE